MNKVNHLRSFTCFSLIFFLCLSVGSRILTQEGAGVDHKHFTISGHSGIATAESQLPFEEKEEETGQDNPSGYGLPVCLKSEYALSDFFYTRSFAPTTFRSRNTLPIYLAKRALLI
jgi:hypothetical protein